MRRSFTSLVLVMAILVFVLLAQADSLRVSQRILLGAKQELANRTRWDSNYPQSNYYSMKYPMGDINPKIGVCTDVLIRSLRRTEIDLQQLVHEDIAANPSAYPLRRYKQKQADSNIDHRRCPNLVVFFQRWEFSQELSIDADWQPGDIVFFDLDQNGWADHVGIVSDSASLVFDRYFVIHLHSQPGYVTEADILDEPTIIGHFRIKKSD